MLDDSNVEDASDRAADDVVVAGGGESLPGNSGTSNRKINQKWKPTTTPRYEPEPESGPNAGSSLDDSLNVNLHNSVFNSNKESDDRESDDGGDRDDTSDIKCDENKDIDILPPESKVGQPTTTNQQDDDKEIIQLHKALYYKDIVL
ncbi:hypothetical protein ARSEF4850_010144 [Beauveria asiatica]